LSVELLVLRLLLFGQRKGRLGGGPRFRRTPRKPENAHPEGV